METQLTAGDMVKDLATQLVVAREKAADANIGLMMLDQELKDRREASEAWRQANATAERLQVLEAALRDAIVEHYKATGEKRAKGVSGVDVAVRKKYKFNQRKLLDWAWNNMPVAVKVTVVPSTFQYDEIMENLPNEIAEQLDVITSTKVDEGKVVRVLGTELPDWVAVEELPGARIHKEIEVAGMEVARTPGGFIDQVMGNWPLEGQEDELPF